MRLGPGQVMNPGGALNRAALSRDGRTLVARLAAPDPQKARIRVLASLEGGDFEVGEPSDESGDKPSE